MTNLVAGCAGWAYPDWKGAFYPVKMNAEGYLSYYTRFFDLVEINTTYYSIPPRETLQHWLSNTPDSFRFIVKVWNKITHQLYSKDVEENVYHFFRALQPLSPKISGYLFQFPPWFTATSDYQQILKQIITIVKSMVKQKWIFLEFRHSSWFDEVDLTKFISSPNTYIVTSFLEGIPRYLQLSQPVQYLRLIGNRQLTSFNRIQLDRTQEMQELSAIIQQLEQSPSITDIFVIFNNHFRGFSPQDVVDLYKLLHRPFKSFQRQHSLDDFLPKKTFSQ